MTFREQIAEAIHNAMFEERFAEEAPNSIARAAAMQQADAVLDRRDTCAVHIANKSGGAIKHPDHVWKLTRVIRGAA